VRDGEQVWQARWRVVEKCGVQENGGAGLRAHPPLATRRPSVQRAEAFSYGNLRAEVACARQATGMPCGAPSAQSMSAAHSERARAMASQRFSVQRGFSAALASSQQVSDSESVCPLQMHMPARILFCAAMMRRPPRHAPQPATVYAVRGGKSVVIRDKAAAKS